jgi:recombination protein RecT
MNQNQNTAVATRKDIMAVLQTDSLKKQVALALPKHMNADRMLRVMLTTVNATGYVGQKLRECTVESLIASLMKCSQYGLEPDGRHAHLIPYGKECQLIFDYKGLVALVRRSGEIKTIHADVVYANDEFSYCYGTGAHLRHKPVLSGERGEIIAAYSFVVSSTGEESFEVMSLDDLLDIRDKSQGYQSAKANKKQTPWDDYFGEMCKKTAFRRHSKWLPLSFELKEAINADDDTPEGRFERAKPAKVEGMFGQITEHSEVPTETASTPEPEPPPVAPAQKAAKAKYSPPTVLSAGEPKSEAPSPVQAAPPQILINDKTRLAEWMSANRFGWQALQPLVAEFVGAWAQEIGSFEELSVKQCTAILAQKAGLEAELRK